jgi:succinate dehydrogenase / fumarate reductase, cytochrome b subunit
VSPHLQIYRMMPTMAMSIVHRITGGALYFGTLLLAWWLIAAATSETISTGQFGLRFLVRAAGAVRLHLGAGASHAGRHPPPDLGHRPGLEKETATKLAWATLAGSIVLTVARSGSSAIMAGGDDMADMRTPLGKVRGLGSARKAPSISGASA